MPPTAAGNHRMPHYSGTGRYDFTGRQPPHPYWDYNEIDSNRVTADEVDIPLREGENPAPVMAKTRILRSVFRRPPAGTSDDDPSGRNVSRGIVVRPRRTLSGLKAFITITGGS